MLDEEGRIPKGNDVSWFNKIKKKYDINVKAKKNWKKLASKTGKSTISKAVSLASASSEIGASTRFEIKFDDFVVVHYAGKVQYRVDGFMKKNKDNISNDLLLLPSTSTSKFVRELCEEKEDVEKNTSETKTSNQHASKAYVGKKKSGSTTKKNRKRTVGEGFCLQLNHLMKTLKSTNSHYIRW